MKSIRNNGSVGRPTGWGRRPHLIQYLLEMIGEAAEESYSKAGFPGNAGIDGKGVAPSPSNETLLCPFGRAVRSW